MMGAPAGIHWWDLGPEDLSIFQTDAQYASEPAHPEPSETNAAAKSASCTRVGLQVGFTAP